MHRVLTKEKIWQRAVKKRDKFTCKKCGTKNRRLLQVHHIRRRADFPMLTMEINNGITLCKKCHLGFKGREELFEYECHMLITNKKNMISIIQRLAKMKAEEEDE